MHVRPREHAHGRPTRMPADVHRHVDGHAMDSCGRRRMITGAHGCLRTQMGAHGCPLVLMDTRGSPGMSMDPTGAHGCPRKPFKCPRTPIRRQRTVHLCPWTSVDVNLVFTLCSHRSCQVGAHCACSLRCCLRLPTAPILQCQKYDDLPTPLRLWHYYLLQRRAGKLLIPEQRKHTHGQTRTQMNKSRESRQTRFRKENLATRMTEHPIEQQAEQNTPTLVEHLLQIQHTLFRDMIKINRARRLP